MGNEDIWKLIIEKEMAGLRRDVESIKAYLFSTTDPKKILEDKLKLFEGQEEMVRVYLECDGEQNRKEISTHSGVKGPNVTRAIKKLRKRFLVYPTKNSQSRSTYTRSPIDEEIGLPAELAKIYLM